ncbi:hypothetical protein SAMN05216377_12112 [Pseudonocardia oroxyli]|uniref:DUF5753 domain-containing protein n=2 Tax=Pseudonocardia oroxyli TaxID=366584 RepID=A0A1G8BDT4_PSEOR|nr:hypothetical protein SAMN05216377_12112 [Pseudonocardia oroxyli]
MAADLYQLDGSETERLTRLVREARSRGWWHDYTDVVPAGSATFYGLEDGAARVSHHSVGLIPGLFQTAAYARSLVASVSGVSKDTMERRVALRMRRQLLLQRPNPPATTVLLDEAVLHRRIGGSVVMCDQLRHLLDLSQRSAVDLRVVPFSAGAYSPAGVGFTVFEFNAVGVTPVVFTEHLSRNTFIDEPDEVAVYRSSIVDGGVAALDAVGSRALITERIEALH